MELASFMKAAVQWMQGNENIIALIGIPLLTLVVTSMVQRRNARLGAAIKLAEMRQAWIRELRSEFINFATEVTTIKLMRKVETERIIANQLAIIFLMNRSDARFVELSEAMQKCMEVMFDEDPELIANSKQRFSRVTSAILKAEWNRLKADLKGAKIV